ncbi:hypothetical protein N7449_001948 [Penicillium cf. viridicatum]|uniref:Xylanolytic transcriptional activator regulatory domain-containing protein n=1 Tax=Penicillium cf. viridicatum TaxID=2972119 RepID=A0A9W9N920_9EURO|nr:hypothetical protein N7449_001948 [Penicillium cf. viridicatum]
MQDGGSVQSTLETLGSCQPQDINRRICGGSFATIAFPSSELQSSDVARDEPESRRAPDLDSSAHVDAVAAAAESDVAHGTSRISSNRFIAPDATNTEAIWPTEHLIEPWFYPFSSWGIEDWVVESGPEEGPAAPSLNMISRDNSNLGSINASERHQGDESNHSPLPQCSGFGGNDRSTLPKFPGAQGLSTVTSMSSSVIPQRTEPGIPRSSSHYKIYFPKLLPGDADVVASENFCHVPPLSSEVYERMVAFYRNHHTTSSHAGETSEFPNLDVLNSFMQLYFEFVHPHLPVLHLPTFNPGPESWMLVLAVVAAGCHHSAIENQHEFAVPLRDLLHQAIMTKLLDVHRIDCDLILGQTVLLHQLLMVFSGTAHASLKSQYQRSILATVCRPFISGDGSIFNKPECLGSDRAGWFPWIERESWNRLVYFTWYIECLQAVIWDLSPIISTREIYRSVPSHEAIWSSSTMAQWDFELGRQRGKSSYLVLPGLHSLNQDTSDGLSLVALFSSKNTKVHESIKGLQGSARLIAMASIFVEEKRLLRETQSWLFSRFRNSAAGEYRENIPTPNSVQSRRPLDEEFELFKDQLGPGIERTALATTHMKTYHLLSILRRVPSRTLFMYFGWMTTAQGADVATRTETIGDRGQKKRPGGITTLGNSIPGYP